MIDDKLLLAHNVFSNKGAYSLFLGSGISRSAGIPTGWEILQQLIKRIALLESEEEPADPENWYLQKYASPPGYSQIIEKLTLTQEERVNLLKPFFEATDDEIEQNLKQPTAAHKAIAKLVQKGYIRVILTTNFDRLMENALREIGIEATIISNPNHVENVMPLIHSSITIVKINGDYLDTKFLNIESELNEYDARMTDYLKYIFENFELITSGWSATWDFALKNILKSANKYRFSNYFSYINQKDELEEIATFRNGKLIHVKDADTLFRELQENIEALESGFKDSPLSKPVAVARLKKYIEKSDQKIPLFELINEDLEKTFQAVNNQPLPYPNQDTVKSVIEFSLSKLDTSCSLLIQGIYWGKESHHDIWLRVITKHAHPIRHSTSYAIWTTLKYLPPFVLFYAAGLACFQTKDYLLLKKLFSIQIFNPYRDGEKISILQNVNADEVIERRQLNELYGKNQYVPQSELLFTYLKPYFDSWMTNETEFEDLFDTYELLYSLQFIKIMGKVWFPRGRYIYRRRSSANIIYTKLEELKQQQENLDWIKAGLFKDFNEMLECYTYFNDEVKKTHF